MTSWILPAKEKPPSVDSDFSYLVLTVYKLTWNDFHSSATDVVHPLHPQHLIFRFEGFRYALFFRKAALPAEKTLLLPARWGLQGKPFFLCSFKRVVKHNGKFFMELWWHFIVISIAVKCATASLFILVLISVCIVNYLSLCNGKMNKRRISFYNKGILLPKLFYR